MNSFSAAGARRRSNRWSGASEIDNMASLGDFDDDRENRDSVIPPDGGWGWIIVTTSAVCNSVTEGFFYSFPLITVELVQVLQEPVTKIASIFPLFGGFILMAASLTNQLIDRLGFHAIRPAMMSATVLASAALAASSFVDSVNYLFATIAMTAGLGFGTVHSSSLKAVSFYFEKRRTLANRISAFSSALGVSICAPLTAILLDNYGWRGAILLQSGIYLNCAVFSLLVRPIDSINMRRRRANAKVPAVRGTPLMQRIKRDRDLKLGILIANSLTLVEESSHPASSVESFYSCEEVPVLNRMSPLVDDSKLSLTNQTQLGSKNVIIDPSVDSPQFETAGHTIQVSSLPLRSPYFLLICISSFVLCLGYLVPYTFLPLTAEISGHDKKSASYLLAVIGLADFAGRFAFHWIAHHFRRNILVVLNATLTVCAIVTILAQRYFFDTYTDLVIVSAIFGCSVASIKVTWPLLLPHLVEYSNAIGAIYFVCAFSVASSGPLAAFVYSLSGEPLYLAGSLLLGSAILACSIGRTEKHIRL